MAMHSLRISAMGFLLRLLPKNWSAHSCLAEKGKCLGAICHRGPLQQGVCLCQQKKPPAVLILADRHYVALVPPEDQSVPSSWLKETVGVVIDLSGAGRSDSSDLLLQFILFVLQALPLDSLNRSENIIHTYIYHITLHYITLHYIKLHYTTYMHACIHT